MADQDYSAPQLFIAGRWIDAGERDTLPVLNPATGDEIGRVPVATRADLDEALDAAAKGFRVWRRTSAIDRSAILRRAANLLRERAPVLGRLTTLEQGKPIEQSIMEMAGCGEYFDWFAEEGRRAYGRVVPSRQRGVRHLVIPEPIGPVAAFTPWNFPATIPSRKIGAALGAGCSMVIKPAEETPWSALALAQALDDAGLPKGVLNVVFGVPAEISTYLIASPIIRKVTFTGSTAIGKQLARLAADGMKPATMELGGHAPVLIFDDADLDAAVAMMMAAKFRNAGQICIAPTRFYLQNAIHDRFCTAFAAAASNLKVGNGMEPGVQMGPLANPRRVPALTAMISDAVEAGATLACGGNPVSNAGFFLQPTVLTNVPDTARIMSEEPFGPVIVTQPFDDLDDAIAKANRLPFGLASYAFTRSARIMRTLGEEVETGMIGINFPVLTGPETPFGGVKDSGHGSDGGPEALAGCMVNKYIVEG